MAQPTLEDSRAEYSRNRLAELRNRLGKLPELREFPGLAIFAAGSYGRLEASRHSDLDLFFFVNCNQGDVKDPRTKQLRLYGKVIETADQMDFPRFSNDCEYLNLLYADDILENLGSRVDDHRNYFTARMLSLLEGRCLFGDDMFSAITGRIVSSYFKDFPDHPITFQPIFLINDICRYWKTMLLNYEHKRKFTDLPPEEVKSKKTKQKVRNFKLKFSRMTTCFASIAALGSFAAPVTEEQVIAVTRLTPRERLACVAQHVPSARSAVSKVLERYSWFLEMTGLSTDELEGHFSDKEKRTEMFRLANEYGDSMYDLLHVVDSSETRLRLLRTLVI